MKREKKMKGKEVVLGKAMSGDEEGRRTSGDVEGSVCTEFTECTLASSIGKDVKTKAVCRSPMGHSKLLQQCFSGGFSEEKSLLLSVVEGWGALTRHDR